MKKIIDKGHEEYSPYRSKCAKCRHFYVMSLTCNAFPDGIPEMFLSGTDIHNKIVNGQKSKEIFNPIS